MLRDRTACHISQMRIYIKPSTRKIDRQTASES